MNLFFRPAFLEEYERYENELNQIYENYVIKFRCYTYLQQQLQQLLSLNEVLYLPNFQINFFRLWKNLRMTLFQAAVTNLEANDQDDTLDKMSSLVDDGSLSSPSPPPAPALPKKPVEATSTVKKSVGSRIRTAVGEHPWNWRSFTN